MREHEPAGPGVRNEPLGDCLVGRLHQLVGRQPGGADQNLDLELAADRGRHPEGLVGLVGEPVEAAPEHLAHPLRDRRLPGGVGVSAQAALAREQAHDLADEEGVAVGLGDHRVRQPRGRRRAGRHLDVPRDRAGVEPAETEATAVLQARDLAQHARQRMLASQLDVAVGADDQQAARGELPRGEAQQEQARLIRPVQVVEDHHHRAVPRRRDQEAADRVEDAEAGLLALGVVGGLDVEALGHLRDELRHVRRPAAELPGEGDRIRVADV